MNLIQKEISISPKSRGFHLITDEFLSKVPEIKSIKIGTMHIFLKHTSASILLNENCDSTVRSDMENFVNDVIPNKTYFRHTYEGDDGLVLLNLHESLGALGRLVYTDGEALSELKASNHPITHREGYKNARLVWEKHKDTQYKRLLTMNFEEALGFMKSCA